MKYICSVCGYITERNPPSVCVVCKSKDSFVPFGKAEAGTGRTPAKGTASRYMCKVCGYIIDGKLLNVCPVCKTHDAFVLVGKNEYQETGKQQQDRFQDEKQRQQKEKQKKQEQRDKDDLNIIKQISDDEEFINAMLDLKKNDIIEYQFRMSQFRNQIEQQKGNNPQSDPAGRELHCPVCGSMHVQKIGTVNRTFSTGIFGLASDKTGKQYQCMDCKHLW